MPIAKAALVRRVRRRLKDHPWLDVAAASLDASATSLNVGQPTQWSIGDRMEFDDGTGEVVRVSATPSANPVTFTRAFEGTTAAAHANGAVLLKNPEYAHDDIVEAIESAIDGLWPHVYAVDTADLALVQGTHYYDPPDDIRELIALTQYVGATLRQYGTRGSGLPFGLVRNLPEDLIVGGNAIWVQGPRAGTAKLTYARDVVSDDNAGTYDDIDDGLPADAIVHVVCAKLLEDRELQRVRDDVQQGDIGVPPQAAIRNAAYFQQKADQLIRQWRLRLDREYPLVSTFRR